MNNSSVIRGGSWLNNKASSRAADRYSSGVDFRSRGIGFRLTFRIHNVYRTFLGGACSYVSLYCRSEERLGYAPSSLGNDLGFRLRFEVD